MGKSAPSAPDPYASAAAQYQYGTEAATYNKALNATNQVGPTGSTTNAISGYDPRTGAPIYTQTTALTKPEQGLLAGSQAGGATAQGLGGGAYSELSGIESQPLTNLTGVNPSLETNLNTSNVSPLPNESQIMGINANATNAVLAGGEAALDPLLKSQFDSINSTLINSGNGPGTPGYETAMRNFMANEGGDMAQLEGSAATAGANVGQTIYGEEAGANQQGYTEDLQTMTANNQALGMSEQDALAAAQAQIQQRSALASLGTNLYGAGQINIPTASGLPTSAASTPDIMSAFQNQYQGQLAQYNANVGTTDAALSDAAMIAAAMA